VRLVRTLVKQGQDKRLEEGYTALTLKNEIQTFYSTNARGPEEKRPPDESVLNIICALRDKSMDIKSMLIVDEVEKLYFEASWALKDEGPRAVSFERPRPQRNQLTLQPQPAAVEQSPPFSSPSKRSSEISQSRTSRSAKRSRPHSSSQTFTTAPSESRTSLSQNQTTRVHQCYCGYCEKTFASLKLWKKHDNTHHPLYFAACVQKDCPHVTLRQDSMNQHFIEHHREKNPSDPELKARQRDHEFVILDRCHSSCIYCEKDFAINDAKRSKKHIVLHQKNETPEVLRGKYRHRCADPNCGRKGHWKTSRFVKPENRQRRDRNDNGIETDESDGLDGTETSDRDDQFEAGSQSHHSHDGRVRTSRGGMRSINLTRDPATQYLSPYPPPQSISDRGEAAAANDPIRHYLVDTDSYALESSQIPTRGSPSEARRQMGWELAMLVSKILPESQTSVL
jgi:hypothetical protein